MNTIRNELKLFDSIIMEIDALYSELAKRSGLTDSSFWVLYYLTQLDEEITQKSICDQWALSKQTVNNAIHDLQKKGYIYLIESQRDRRSKQICLTPSGAEFTELHIKKIFAMEESIFSQMSPKERKHLISSNETYLHFLRQELL
ncbi:MAG: MarR family transcriptional regulator [Lachnospiraceae bacterium]